MKPLFAPIALACMLALPRAAVSAPSYDELAPILAARCTMCHAGAGAPLGLALDSYEALMRGSQRGAVVKAGNGAGSELIRRLKGQSQPRMPMTGPPFLSDAEVALFEQWIAAGAPAGSGKAGAVPAPARPKPGETVTYAHVAPIFATRCAKCHTDNGLMGAPPEGYRLTSHTSTLDPTDRVRVVPGNPDASELVRKIRGQSRPRMPHDGPPWLSDVDIGLIEDWVRQGARDAAGQPAPIPAGAAVRLRGTLDGASLDGLPFDARGARIDKGPRSGDYVELRGRVEADGSITAQRLRRR